MSKAMQPTTDAPTGLPCVAGDDRCPGPDASGLPCFECYSAATCPEGRGDCDARATADTVTALCFNCAVRRSTGPLTL